MDKEQACKAIDMTFDERDICSKYPDIILAIVMNDNEFLQTVRDKISYYRERKDFYKKTIQDCVDEKQVMEVLGLVTK